MALSKIFDGLKTLGITSRLLASLSVLCLVAPFVVGVLQVDNSDLVPLIIGEDIDEGLPHANAGAFEGPGWDDESLTTGNNVIPEDQLMLDRIFDLPSGGPPSPLFGATPFSQMLLRFEEFGTMNNETSVLPAVSFPGLQDPDGDGLTGGDLDQDGLPIPGGLEAHDCPDGEEVELFLDQPLTLPTLRISNEFDQNPWRWRIEDYLDRPCSNLPIEGRPPGEGWAHQRWAEFPPQRVFQTMVTGARTNLGFRDAMQDHLYEHGVLAGDSGDCEFGPGGLYHETYDEPDGFS
ncbi:MAG: hypothetical protein AAEJ47_07995, partial [Planctomycetota bacterium]